jgi:hypothetical protein
MVGMKVATKAELEEYYDLDEALKMFAIYHMGQDIQAAKIEEVTKTRGKGRRRQA